MNDYLACNIYRDIDNDTESITLQVHTKDDEVLVFHDLLNDPIFVDGWLHIEHDVLLHKMYSQVQESRVNYLTHYRKERTGSQ